MAVVEELERQRQQCLEPDDPIGRGAERQALGILVPRRMIAGNRVDRAVAQAFDHCPPVPFAAQWRGKLGEGAVIADRRLVEREIGRRGITGYGQPLRLGPPNRVDPGGGRNMGDVVAPTSDLDQPQIALDHDDFGHRRDRRESQSRGGFPFSDFAGAGKARLFGVLQHQEIEGAGIGENPPHDERIGHRLHAIGKAERAVRRKEAHLG